jgi:hypothetical protein
MSSGLDSDALNGNSNPTLVNTPFPFRTIPFGWTTGSLKQYEPKQLLIVVSKKLSFLRSVSNRAAKGLDESCGRDDVDILLAS